MKKEKVEKGTMKKDADAPKRPVGAFVIEEFQKSFKLEFPYVKSGPAIISQGSLLKDSDNVVTPSLHDKIQLAADEELIQCLEILNNMEEIDDDNYSKALKFFMVKLSGERCLCHRWWGSLVCRSL